jgi:hypothetical protein
MRVKSLLAAFLLLPFLGGTAAAQTLIPETTISTAGDDCLTATSCATIPYQRLQDSPSFGVYIDVGTSGTYVFEAMIKDGVWFAVDDDINASSTLTSDGARFFSNPGYKQFRVRASAIDGSGTVTIFKGLAGLRSTATLSGEAQGDGAIQDGADSGIEATVFDYSGANPLAVVLVDTDGVAYEASGGGGGGGAAQADDSALGDLTAAGALYDTTPPAVTDGNIGAFRMDSDRILFVKFSSAQTVNLSATDNAVLDDIADGIAVTQSGTWNITNVSGTVSLPTGASTAANQTTVIGHVDGLEGVLGTAADATATAGSTGTLSAKLRLITSLLDDMNTNTPDLVDGRVPIQWDSDAFIIARPSATESFLNESLEQSLQTAATADGVGGSHDVEGYPTVIAQVTISNTATVTFKRTHDGTNWEAVKGLKRVTAEEAAQVWDDTITDTGTTYWEIDVANWSAFRAEISGCSSCTVTVISRATFGQRPRVLSVVGLKPDGTNTMPSLDAVGRRGYFSLTDGTNTMPTGDAAARALWTQETTSTSGGCTPGSSLQTSGAVLETQIKGTAGQLYALSVSSLDATPVYIKVYNDTAANVDETDTPVLRYGIPGYGTDANLNGREVPIPAKGIEFGTAITFRVTTGIADNDTGALTANEVMVSYCYK